MPFYTAYFKDSRTKIAPVHFRSPDDAKAKDFANKMALKSKAKWTRLTKITAVAVDDQVFGTYGGNPEAGSNVQVQAKGVYNSSVPKNTIGVTIPAVKTTVVNDGTTVERTTDPLSAQQKGELRSENGATATTMKQYTYNHRLRK